MRYFDWDFEKNEQLIRERGISFEEVVIALDEGRQLAIVENPNQVRYHGQKIIVVEIQGYAHLVPFVEDEEKIFFKTIIPSRKATKKYLNNI